MHISRRLHYVPLEGLHKISQDMFHCWHVSPSTLFVVIFCGPNITLVSCGLPLILMTFHYHPNRVNYHGEVPKNKLQHHSKNLPPSKKSRTISRTCSIQWNTLNSDLHPRSLTARPWKMMVGRSGFLLERAYFQGRTVKLPGSRNCSNLPFTHLPVNEAIQALPRCFRVWLTKQRGGEVQEKPDNRTSGAAKGWRCFKTMTLDHPKKNATMGFFWVFLGVKNDSSKHNKSPDFCFSFGKVLLFFF